MPDWTDSPDPQNPFLPSKLQTLGMMLQGMGAGIAGAAERNQPAWMGVAPGAGAFTNNYYSMLSRGMNYDLARKNYELNAAYKTMQERKLGLETDMMKRQIDAAHNIAIYGNPFGPMGGGGAGGPPPGMRVPQPTMGPNFNAPPNGDQPPPAAIPPGVQMRMPLISQASAQYGVRPELAAGVFSTESSGDPSATGPMTRFGQAKGIAQLTDGTAHDLGVTNPYDPQQGINGGTNYLGQMIRRYNGNETLGLIAYNYGPGNTDAWLKGGGDPSKLPAETQNFVQKVQGYATAASGGPQSPQAGPQVAQVQPSGMPQMPGPPPDVSQYKMFGAAGPVFGTYGNAKADQLLQQYKYNWQKYNAELEARKYGQPSAVGPYVRVGDRLIDPNSGKPAGWQPGQTPTMTPTSAPVPPSASPNGGRNESYLAQLAAQNPDYAQDVKLLVEGKKPMPTGRGALSTPYWNNLFRDAHAYDPSFDPKKTMAQFDAIKSWMGQGKNQVIIQSFDQLMNHVGGLFDAYPGLKNHGGFPGASIVNSLGNAAALTSNGGPQRDFLTHKEGVAAEATTIFKGTGNSSDAEIGRLAANIDENDPPKAFFAGSRALFNMVEGRLAAQRQAFNRATDQNLTRDQFEAQFLSPEARAQMAKIRALKESDFTGAKAAPQTQQAPQVAPPDGAIAKLKMNPSLAPAFDEKYGPGAAAKILGVR